MYNRLRRGPRGRLRSELGQDRKIAALRIQSSASRQSPAFSTYSVTYRVFSDLVLQERF